MEEAPYPRFASRGRAFVYVVPCRDEDLLKLGFSRDPFTRFSTLHRRFFEFFDLDRGMLVDAERVAAARGIERQLIEAFTEHQATAPLAVRAAAGGHTEWYRGAHADVAATLRRLADGEGLLLRENLRPWLREHLMARADLLHDWSLRIVDTLDWARNNAPDDPGAARLRRALLDTWDMFEAAGIDVRSLVPASVSHWHEHGDHRRLFPDQHHL
ncbi:GIY-YIG nuclease family protein [Luteibacter yeojuensis]|uniref:GIY-YIG nuclease family protein n=1 Tax=Luteibacter yeojuensis TaxID=345309 RepID=A0A7X5QTE0_9GAMM|nr:GIY-YIG nuclease family protein [Luteibacter yeojuensis]NID15085.1 GIY-YIG nuclease family protein [Luteibacter yeojuensis]